MEDGRRKQHSHKEEGGKQHHPNEEEEAAPPKGGGWESRPHPLGGAAFLLLLWVVLPFPLHFRCGGVPLFFVVVLPFSSFGKKLMSVESITISKCIKNEI